MDSGVDLPANGGFDVVGTFSVLTFVQDTDLRFYPVHGDSFIAVIEFGETVRAKVLLTHGNATQPNSPHVGDQLALFSAQQLRDAWRTRAEVEANLARREVLRVP
jgi:acyl-homoserine-lactone acylase